MLIMIQVGILLFTLQVACTKRFSPYLPDETNIKMGLYEIHEAILKYVKSNGIAPLHERQQVASELTNVPAGIQWFQSKGWTSKTAMTLISPSGIQYEVLFAKPNFLVIRTGSHETEVDLNQPLEEFWRQPRQDWRNKSGT